MSDRLALPETYSLTFPSEVLNIGGNDRWMYTPFTQPVYPLQFPTTDGTAPLSNIPDNVAENYMNVLFPYRIEKVIFHDPATIVIWKDGKKTVVKCHGEPFDREKGLAMCVAKKVFGEKFHSTFREWCKE